MSDYAVYDTDEVGTIVDPLDVQVCSVIGQTLVDEYSKPAARHGVDLNWHVEAVHKAGVVKVALDAVHKLKNQRYAYVEKIRGMVTYDMMRDMAKRIGGELLERAHMSRTTGLPSKNEIHRD